MSTFTRRGRAIAAAGTVIGIGAVATLAAWSDAEFARASLSSGSFAVEASQTQDFQAPSEALNFIFDTNGQIKPDTTVQTTHWLRVAKGSTASVTIQAPIAVNSDVAKLFDVTVTAGQCGTTGETLQSGTLTELQAVADAITLPAATDNAPGEPQALCFSATLPSAAVAELAPGDYSTGKVTWPITVTEVSSDA